MNKLKQKLIDALNAFVDENDSYEIQEFSKTTLPGLEGYSVTTEKVHGGCEGGGEEHWIVLSVTEIANNEVSYWKIPGWYQSYHGAEIEIDNLHKVVPKQVTVTQWEKK